MQTEGEFPDGSAVKNVEDRGAGDRQSRKLRVVVVDDSPAALSAMVQLVGAQSVAMVAGTAEDGPSGLGMALRLLPDLVITDVTMPGFDGFHLVKCLRQELPLVRTVVTSANDGAAWQRASKAHGADAFIPKEKLADDLPGMLDHLFSPNLKPTSET